jgi:hypothetical protein
MLGGLSLAGLALASPGAAQAPGPWTSFMHVWTDAAGVSHAEHVPISAEVKAIPVDQMTLRSDPRTFVDWHVPPNPQFNITLSGEYEVEVSDGTRLKPPASGLAFVEDMTGKGHITRLKNPVNIYLRTPKGFDVRRWARGEA